MNPHLLLRYIQHFLSNEVSSMSLLILYCPLLVPDVVFDKNHPTTSITVIKKIYEAIKVTLESSFQDIGAFLLGKATLNIQKK